MLCNTCICLLCYFVSTFYVIICVPCYLSIINIFTSKWLFVWAFIIYYSKNPSQWELRIHTNSVVGLRWNALVLWPLASFIPPQPNCFVGMNTELPLWAVLAFIPQCLVNDLVNKYLRNMQQNLTFWPYNIPAVGETRFFPHPLLPLEMSSSLDKSVILTVISL